MVRHTQAEPEQADNGAEQPLGLPVGEAEHRTDRERRQDGRRRIPGLATAGRAWLGRPRFDCVAGELHRQAAALAQAGIVDRPVRHLVPLPRNVVTAVLVQLERQDGHPGLEGRSPTSPSASAPPPNPCTTLSCGAAVGRKRAFKRRQFTAEVILWAVRWYLIFPISHRDLELMLRDRGVDVDYTTIFRWI